MNIKAQKSAALVLAIALITLIFAAVSVADISAPIEKTGFSALPKALGTSFSSVIYVCLQSIEGLLKTTQLKPLETLFLCFKENKINADFYLILMVFALVFVCFLHFSIKWKLEKDGKK